QQVVRRQVLKRVEPGAGFTDLGDRELAAAEVERRDCLDEAEVAGGPRARAREMSREEPVSCPLAEPSQFGQGRLHVVVGKMTQRLEVDVRPCDAEYVLGLAAREPKLGQMLLARLSHP